jgi:hypothetical protein
MSEKCIVVALFLSDSLLVRLRGNPLLQAEVRRAGSFEEIGSILADHDCYVIASFDRDEDWANAAVLTGLAHGYICSLGSGEIFSIERWADLFPDLDAWERLLTANLGLMNAFEELEQLRDELIEAAGGSK